MHRKDAVYQTKFGGRVEHRRVIGQIDRQEPHSPPRWSLSLLVAAFMAAFGVAMVGYLLQL